MKTLLTLISAFAFVYALSVMCAYTIELVNLGYCIFQAVLGFGVCIYAGIKADKR